MEEPADVKIHDPKFWERVAVLPNLNGLDCWIMMAERKKHGHASIHRVIDGKDRNIPAHRYAWYLYYGELPPPRESYQWVLHKLECQDSLCVRKEHLYLGTPQQNMNDLSRSGKARNYFTGRLYRPHWKELLGGESPPDKFNRHEKIRVTLELDIQLLRKMAANRQHIIVEVPQQRHKPRQTRQIQEVQDADELSRSDHADPTPIPTSLDIDIDWLFY